MTPRNFIHQEFAHHADTVDTFHLDAQISHIHIHCEFLHQLLAQYVTPDRLRMEPFRSIIFNPGIILPVPYHFIPQAHPSLRAPPLTA